MIIYFKALYQHVIYIDLHCFTNKISEHLINWSLIRGLGVFQLKGHHLAAVEASTCYKRHMFFINMVHGDMVVV